MSEMILYASEGSGRCIQPRAEGNTVWLTQEEMAELFDVISDNIDVHLKKIFGQGVGC